MILKYVCCDQSVADYMYLILTLLSKRRTSKYSPLSRDVNAAKDYLRSQRGNTEAMLNGMDMFLVSWQARLDLIGLTL
jgi:hypothetical protein